MRTTIATARQLRLLSCKQALRACTHRAAIVTLTATARPSTIPSASNKHGTSASAHISANRLPNLCAFSTTARKPPRPDPLALRPTSKCDPYGQQGRPMTLQQAKDLLSTVESAWQIVDLSDSKNMQERQTHHEHVQKQTAEADSSVPIKAPPNAEQRGVTDTPAHIPYYALQRSYTHPSLAAATHWLSQVAAVAEQHAHAPFELRASRKRQRRQESAYKHRAQTPNNLADNGAGSGDDANAIADESLSWIIESTVTCHTQVLGGLSINDYHLAMVSVDVPQG
jgi:hypothetical protein